VGARAVTREMRDDLQGNKFSDWVVFGCPAFNVLVISADFDHQQEITLFLTLSYYVTCMIPIEILYLLL
jgi:hypothetical protein